MNRDVHTKSGQGVAIDRLPALPDEPGCYLYRDGEGTVIYVGKAKNLKKRVASYFQKRGQDAKTTILVSRIASVDYIVTTNEVEALVLENSLIKEHLPRYNINLKDAKQYAYIRFTGEEFPRLCIARKATGDGTFFGPFVSAQERDYVFSVIKKTFRLRTCRKLQKRGCLRLHINSCTAPCRQAVSAEEYAAQVRNATLVLKGKSGELIEALRAEMAFQTERMEYEQALLLRDQIQAIEHLGGRQDVARKRETDEDIINYRVAEGKVYLMLFNIYRGTLVNKKEFVFDEGEDLLEEFLARYYAESDPPGELVLPEEVTETLGEFFCLRKGGKVTVTVPKLGAKKRLLDLVGLNIETVFFGGEIKLIALAEQLGLGETPRVIECFDISHLAGTAMVGSMVQFRDARPDKRNYRRFRIKSVEGIDDPRAIAEVVCRRYTRLKKDETPLPDLVVIDGGRAQLAAALGELKKLQLAIPVIALAKRNEEVYVPGRVRPLPLDRKEKASLFIQEIRDEAHRFAVSYNRLLRRKKIIV